MSARALLGGISALVAVACSQPTDSNSTPKVTRVVVVPESIDVALDSTKLLTATAHDASDSPMAGITMAWTSAQPNVVSVSGNGTVTGEAVGTTTIAASAGGISGNARVRVVAVPPDTADSGDTTAAVNECAAPSASWIFCDDFEANRLSSYFEVENPGGRFTRVAGVGRSNSLGMRGQWTVGAQSAGALHLAFGATPQAYFDPVDAGTTKHRSVYWRIYVRRQAGWTGGGGDKLTRATIFASGSSWAQAMAAHVWSGMGANINFLTLDPASGTDASGSLTSTGYNDLDRWLGASIGPTPMFGASYDNVWVCVESYVKLNDAGQSNGEFRVWLNEQLEAEKTGLNWVGSFSAYGINAIFVENYWNAGSPAAQERYFDNFVVSTARIGC